MNSNDINNCNEALPFGEIIQGRKLIIPLYQRNYKWNSQQVVTLISNIIESYENGTDKSVGLITLYKAETDNAYYIIDGQQRTITLSIILSLLKDNDSVNLTFARDGDDKLRYKALHEEIGKNAGESTDTDRIRRNSKAMAEQLHDNGVKNLGQHRTKTIFWILHTSCLHLFRHIAQFVLARRQPCVVLIVQSDEKSDCAIRVQSLCGIALDLRDYILKRVIMLCSVVTESPEKEFMNLNAYKTKFSVCDFYRAHIITLNTFYKNDLKNNIEELSAILENSSYKTAVASLYNAILDVLYYKKKSSDEKKLGNSVFGLFMNNNTFWNENSTESRINIFFEDEKKSKQSANYQFEPANIDKDYLIKMLTKMSCVLNLLTQVKDDIEGQNYSTSRAISDFHKLKNVSFISKVMKLDVQDVGGFTISKALERLSNVNRVLIEQLDRGDFLLSNRIFEDYVYARESSESDNSAEHDEYEYGRLSAMSRDDIEECISSTGKYVLNRFTKEREAELDFCISIPPVISLEDEENKFGNGCSVGNEATVAELFSHNICIPVIQRDYCMGAQITDSEKSVDFLEYLINSFKDDCGHDVVASTIIISEADNGDVYIFDGQQRTYTIYNLLKFLDMEGLNEYRFIGRKNESKYSEYSVSNLRKAFDKRCCNIDKEKFCEYIRNHLRFIVKKVGGVSSAEQFFMDVNGGVALEPYEIFKSCLYSRLEKLEESGTVRFLENDMLQALYALIRKNYESELDEEEIVEMRLVEYVCRYIYCLKNPTACPDIFDKNADNKTMIVANAQSYLECMDKDDFAIMRHFLEALCHELNSRDATEDLFKLRMPKMSSLSFELDSYNNYAYGIYADSVCETRGVNELMKEFCLSFRNTERKILLSIYGDSLDELRNVYDEDEVFRYYWAVQVDNEPHPCKPSLDTMDSRRVFVLAGYHNIKELNGFAVPEIALPAYYFQHVTNDQRKNYYLPYLKNHCKTTLFRLGDASMIPVNIEAKDVYVKSLEYDEQDRSYKLTFSNEWLKIIRLTNRTDAYVAKSNTVKDQLLKIEQ